MTPIPTEFKRIGDTICTPHKKSMEDTRAIAQKFRQKELNGPARPIMRRPELRPLEPHLSAKDQAFLERLQAISHNLNRQRNLQKNEI